MALTTQHHKDTDAALTDVLTLIHNSFAGMDGRIDPPSSVHSLTLAALQKDAADHEVWSLGTPPRACVLLKTTQDALYVGKLAVAASHRHQGLATRLIDLANSRAKHHGVRWLTLQARIELTENHATFTALGFSEVARTTHPGYTKPTAIEFRRAVS